ncbi:MAG: S41 family peptidase [Pirellulaceae bacterium]|nr:S41 family peptidase [Pirellulaceae bacterium]MDP7018070.1 S41 family peptidase [Pirellulaceae bacterium]
MIRRILLLSAVLAASTAYAEDAKTDDVSLRVDQQTQALVDRFVLLTEAIDRHHLDPPAVQQLLLAGVRDMYFRVGVVPPPGQSRLVSDSRGVRDRERILRRAVTDLVKQKREISVEAFGSAVATASGGLLQPIDPVARQLRDNQYVGIGIQLSQEEKRPLMAGVFAGGPAALAGARRGDRIMAIDGVDTEGMNLSEVVRRLRGPRGAAVQVVVQKKTAKPRTLDLVRNVVPIATLEGYSRREDESWNYIAETDETVGYVKVVRLIGSTIPEMQKLLREFQRQEVESVLLDLTQLNGGAVRHAMMFADLWLGEANVGAHQTARQRIELKTTSRHLAGKFRLVVYVGPRTSGVGEWLAAAIQDQKRGMIVGSPTLGGCIVRTEVDLLAGRYSLNMPTSIMFRQNGQPLANISRLDSRPPTDPRQVEVQRVVQRQANNAKQLRQQFNRLPAAKGTSQFGVHPDEAAASRRIAIRMAGFPAAE